MADKGPWLYLPYSLTLMSCLLQRLLWETEGSLAFTAPTVYQFRNPHTLMKDFLDEDDLYKRAGDLVQFLIDWKPSAGADLPIMMKELAQVRLSSPVLPAVSRKVHASNLQTCTSHAFMHFYSTQVQACVWCSGKACSLCRQCSRRISGGKGMWG